MNIRQKDGVCTLDKVGCRFQGERKLPTLSLKLTQAYMSLLMPQQQCLEN